MKANNRGKSSNNLLHPNQPTFIYDINKPWEEVIKSEPIWLSQKFPPRPKLYCFLGHTLISPVVIAAGPASGKIWTDFYFKMGYGAVIQKTMRTAPRSSNLAPNIAIVKASKPIARNSLGQTMHATMNQDEYPKFQSITNSFGNPSPLLSTWANELKEQKKGVNPGQLLGCSVTASIGENSSCSVIFGENPPISQVLEVATDLLTAASVAVTSGADFVELNLACPNVMENTEESEMFQNAKLIQYTLEEFKKRFPNIPIGFKFGLYKDKDQMKRVFAQAGDNLDYVSGINALAMPVEAEDGKDILPGRKKSGVCGRVIKDIALEHIEWASQIREEEGLKYEILGGGGILESEDVDKFLNLGANAVQVATVALTNPLFAHQYSLHTQYQSHAN
ncbi:hypothetical protein HYS91_02470 [Candidatus Daviesbacteria bacterium]|nr:hypothetical protein [Candidatus Daviesbacteria bacterium]